MPLAGGASGGFKIGRSYSKEILLMTPITASGLPLPFMAKLVP
jgi:hypothetical protein